MSDAEVVAKMRKVIAELDSKWRPKAEGTSRRADMAFGYTTALDDMAYALDHLSRTTPPTTHPTEESHD